MACIWADTREAACEYMLEQIRACALESEDSRHISKTLYKALETMAKSEESMELLFADRRGEAQPKAGDLSLTGLAKLTGAKLLALIDDSVYQVQGEGETTFAFDVCNEVATVE